MTTIIEDVKLDFQDVLLMPKRSTVDSRSKVDLTRTFKFKHSPIQYTGISIIAANMDGVGTMDMARAFYPYKMGVALHKFYSEEELVGYYSCNANKHTFYTMGITEDDSNKFKTVWNRLPPERRPQYICIDVANGYSRKFVNFVEKMRTDYPDVVIMAGNVVTGDMVYDLLERGADIVKIGIGSGSVCTTRRVTGVGYPQLSAILECQDAAHGADGLICGDGGIVVPGDLSKAFAAGSDFVMCGGIFAGHDECEGEIIGVNRTLKALKWPHNLSSSDNMMLVEDLVSGKQHPVEIQKFNNFVAAFDHNKDISIPKEFQWAIDTEILENAKVRFYGMSSHEAMDKHYGGKANYRASEGKIVEIPYKGSVVSTIEEILGGLRSACTYVGARRLKDLPKCATFVKTNRQLNDSLTRYNA